MSTIAETSPVNVTALANQSAPAPAMNAQPDLFTVTEPLLTVLSFGGGQDSTALLELYINDPAFRKRYAPRDFMVVMSDTGDEFPETYAHVEKMRERCAQHGIEFNFLTADQGWHQGDWTSLLNFFQAKNTIGSKAFPKTCTDRLKLQPIYRFLENWLSKKYGVQCHHKKGIREFAMMHGKIQVMIGIAKGEERRVADPSKNPNRWYRDSIHNIYPLIDLGMDRAACQAYIANQGLPVPIPSNCRSCPWLSLEELEYLRRFHAEHLDVWVGLEAAKLEKHRDKELVVVPTATGTKTVNKNYGVFGTMPLPVKIREAKEKFADWSDERVREYRMSHGHCVATAY